MKENNGYNLARQKNADLTFFVLIGADPARMNQGGLTLCPYSNALLVKKGVPKPLDLH